MITILIGMKRERLLALADEIHTKFADPTVCATVTIEAVENGGQGRWRTVELSNDDMERPEVMADTVYVDIEKG